MQIQNRLFGGPEPRLGPLGVGVERTVVTPNSWFDVRRGWLVGDDVLFDNLVGTIPWRADRRVMYDRVVEVPRLTAAVSPQEHPILGAAAVALCAHYGRPVCHVSLALYRDGQDSVAWHGDRLGESRRDSIVAVVSLRGPRRFLVRRRGGGPSTGLSLGCGDLIVMGGAAQIELEHSVPKVSGALARMAVMFRSSGVSDSK